VRFDLYVPYLQKPGDPVQHLMVRTSRAPMTLGSVIRAEALRLEPTALVEAVRPMEELVERAIAPWRFMASTLAVLGAIALVLSAFGIYGVIRQSTADSVRELGLRIALGADPVNIVKLVLRDGITMTVLGIGLGAIGAIAAGRVLGVLLFDVSPIDPIAFMSAAGLFVIAASLAALIPALRAARVDPLVALRCE
jgi:ABC-type antimicrobial peptide transport system permease subunit